MSSWHEFRIGDLGAVVTGRTPPTEQPAYFGSDFPFVTPGDMRQGKYTRVTERGLSNSGAELLARIKVPANSICVSCIGWQMGETVMTASESFTNQQINTIIPGINVDPSFLYYSIRTRKMELLSIGSGTGVRTPILKKSAFCNLKVQLPDLSQQRRIASVLSAYDGLIEVNRRRVAILEEMARRLFEEWFVHLRFPGHETVPVHDITDGPMPEGWTIRSFSELGDYVNGFAFKPADWCEIGLPIIKIRELKQGVTADTPRYQSVLATRYKVNDGALLFSWSAHLDAYIWAGGEGWLNQHLFLVTPNESVGRSYLFHALRQAMGNFHKRANGATMHHIKRSALDQVCTLQPPSELLSSYAIISEPLLDQVVNLRRAIQHLAAARDLLLPRLVSGELSVADAAAPERFLEAAD